MHTRRAILEEVQAAIKQRKEYSTVKITRASLLGARGVTYPAVNLYFDSETVSTETMHRRPRPQYRAPILVIRVVLMGQADTEYTEKQFDIHSAIIEKAMMNVVQTVDDVKLLTTEFDLSEEEPMMATLTLSYQVDYTTLENLL